MSAPFIINKYTTREQLREWYGVGRDRFRTMCRKAEVPDRAELGVMEISRILVVNGYSQKGTDIQIPIEENWKLWQLMKSA